MQLVVGFGVGVLLCDARAKLDVGSHRLAKRLVVRQAGLVERLQVERYEPVPLLVGDIEVTMRLDQVLEPQLVSEAVRAAERLSGEPGQVLDVMRLALMKQGAQHGIIEHLGVEQFFEAMQGLIFRRRARRESSPAGLLTNPGIA